MQGVDMQVKLVRSGGLAGLDLVATVDAGDLPADQQDLVAKLFKADLPGSRVGRPGGADQFSYQLVIHQGDRSVQRHWEDSEVPEGIRPLLTALTRQAKPAR